MELPRPRPPWVQRGGIFVIAAHTFIHLLPFYLSAQPLIHPSIEAFEHDDDSLALWSWTREGGRHGGRERHRGGGEEGPIDRVPNWTAPRRGGEYVWPCGGVRLLLSASSLHPSPLPTRPLPPLFPALASLRPSRPPCAA